MQQDNIKEAVEKFGGRMDAIQKKLDSTVKDKRAQAAELFEAAKLQSEIVYSLDIEPILSVEAAANLRLLSRTIALNLSRKRKRDNSRISNNAVLMSKTLKKTTTVLAQALVNSGRETASLSGNAAAFNKKISDMEHRIEAKMEACWGDIKGKLDRTLAAMSATNNNNSS